MIKNILLVKHRQYLIFFIVVATVLWWFADTYGWGKIGALSSMELFFGGLSVAGILLLFFPCSVFKPWAWFSAVYVPLTAIWIIFVAPRYATEWFTTKDELSDIFGVLYLAISVLIAVFTILLHKVRDKK